MGRWKSEDLEFKFSWRKLGRPPPHLKSKIKIKEPRPWVQSSVEVGEGVALN
jgi:hypothetical protein